MTSLYYCRAWDERNISWLADTVVELWNKDNFVWLPDDMALLASENKSAWLSDTVAVWEKRNALYWFSNDAAVPENGKNLFGLSVCLAGLEGVNETDWLPKKSLVLLGWLFHDVALHWFQFFVVVEFENNIGWFTVGGEILEGKNQNWFATWPCFSLWKWKDPWLISWWFCTTRTRKAARFTTWGCFCAWQWKRTQFLLDWWCCL